MAKGFRRKGANTVVWLLMAMLILGLGGFGVTNFGGATQSVATVGGREVGLNDYARALRAELDALSAQFGQPITLAQAQAFGLDQGVRARLIAQAAMDVETDRIGLSAGDGQVRDQIVGASAFRGIDGRFDRELYALALRQQGLTEAAFEAELRNDAARVLLQGAVAGGIAAPAAYVDAVASWAGEARGFDHVTLTADLLAEPVPAPTEAELTAFHAENPPPSPRPKPGCCPMPGCRPRRFWTRCRWTRRRCAQNTKRGLRNSCSRNGEWWNGWSSAPRKRPRLPRRGSTPARSASRIW
ncbi:SurA N-terminal domain-containing protein [Frigidibacter mobilis]|uniref:Peptidyl-prolyl cis-trans isomerase D n=1 Tax=Frigidibacter mobilis TaxID=1335048 RepID=A0A159Z3B0_9RHOB|nr:SurA N-terminal domain-containing protein [Frigidibacter mobilis]AMY68688.1 peptidyl-prolyl cis-trans isomerase D [Frigidibacter mobilis]